MTTETVWKGKYLSVKQAGTWEYAERVGAITAAVIVAIDGGGQLLLVEQHRVPLGRTCLELPAGLVGDESAGESVAEAANRASARARTRRTLVARGVSASRSGR